MVKNVFLGRETRLTPNKTAMLFPATLADKAKIGGGWVTIEDVALGQLVEAVNQVELAFAVGDTLGVKTIIEQRRVYVNVKEIRLEQGQGLSDDIIAQLGYPDRDAYMADWGHILDGRVWLFGIEHIIPGDGTMNQTVN